MSSAAPATTNTIIIRLAIRYGIVLIIAVAVLGGLIGYLVGGATGLLSALLGAVMIAVFMGLTAVSFVVADRVAKLPEGIAVYYGIILGTFLIKFVIFLVLIISLRGAHWLNPTVFGFTLIVAVVGTLVVDSLALLRGRAPYLDVALPGDRAQSTDKTAGDS